MRTANFSSMRGSSSRPAAACSTRGSARVAEIPRTTSQPESIPWFQARSTSAAPRSSHSREKTPRGVTAEGTKSWSKPTGIQVLQNSERAEELSSGPQAARTARSAFRLPAEAPVRRRRSAVRPPRVAVSA